MITSASGAEVAALQGLDGESCYVTAALGNTWSHSVNSRLILQYRDRRRREAGFVHLHKQPANDTDCRVFRAGRALFWQNVNNFHSPIWHATAGLDL